MLNSRAPTNARLERCGYGANATAAAAQEAALENMEWLADGARKFTKKQPDGREGHLPCQKGILRNIASLRGLSQAVREAVPSVKYILTSRVNQDCLENTFSQLRGMGGQNQCPDAVEVRHRLRIMLMAPSPLVAANSRGLAVQLERDCEDDASAAPSEFVTAQVLTNKAFQELDIQASVLFPLMCKYLHNFHLSANMNVKFVL